MSSCPPHARADARTTRRLPAARTLPALGLLGIALFASGIAGTVRAETEREYCERQEGSARIVCLRALDSKSPASSAPAAATPATPSATPAAPPPAAAPASPAAAAAPAGEAPYKVVDGTHVDAKTMEGFRTWRQAACDRCHGPNQEGMVGPSLIASLKTLSQEEFKRVVAEGRLQQGMPAFKTNEKLMQNMDALYAYLKGRSDGAITQANVKPIE